MRELKVHHVSKHSDHYHECPECQVKYKWKHQLTGHLRKAHSNGEGDQATLYACHLCSNTYATGRTLGLHVIKIHNLQRPSGHTRFGFKRCADGFYRLKNERYESFDLAAELEEQKENDADGSSAASVAGTSTSAASPELPLHRDCQDSGAKVIAAYLQQEGIPVANVEIPGKLPIPRLPTTLPAVQFEPTRYDQTGFDDNGVLVYLDSFGLPAGPVTIVDSSLTYYSADPGYLQMPTGEMVALIPGQVYDNGGRIEVIESQEDSGSGQMA